MAGVLAASYGLLHRPNDRLLVAGILIVLWVGGFIAVRNLTVVTVLFFAPIYRALIRGLRSYVEALAYLVIGLADSSRITEGRAVAMEQSGWEPVDSGNAVEPGVVDASAAQLMDARGAGMSRPLAAFIVVITWILRLLPEPLPDYYPVPHGRYTLD
jgi:hypothetical protein